MDRKSSWTKECPVVQTLERVGERWSILLLRELFRGAHRFDELQTSLGIAPNILSTRLTRLVDAGFVEKRLYQEHPPRHSYHLTQRGEDFIPVLFVLLEFGNKHFAPEGPKVVVVNNDTAETARVLMFSTVVTPTATVYPDSDKVGIWTGDKETDVLVRRSSRVGYYDGET